MAKETCVNDKRDLAKETYVNDKRDLAKETYVNDKRDLRAFSRRAMELLAVATLSFSASTWHCML